MVNDPYMFGQVAAANALSDVYAMGGTPWTAMNIVCFPVQDFPASVLKDVLEGGKDKVAESGALLVGGHSVEDTELKYGLSVTGYVDPDRFASNRGLRAGDTLLLTKPIGTGVLATALKAEWEGHEEYEKTIAHWSARLNKSGGEVIQKLGLTGATDITGFGLGGHLLEMAAASGVSVEIEVGNVPFLEDAIELAGMGLLPAGSICNRDHFLPRTRTTQGLDDILCNLVFDAQTSGGLVLSVPTEDVDRAKEMLLEAGDLAAEIGHVLPRSDKELILT